MKLSIDKDKLVKHKFWILFGIAVPLICGGLFLLLSPVAAEIDKERRNADRIRAASQPSAIKVHVYNSENIEEKKNQVKKSQKQETEEWAKVYEAQARGDSLFWPTAIEKAYRPHDGKFLRELNFMSGDLPPNDANHVSGKIVKTENPAITIRTKNKHGKDEDVVVYRMGPKMMAIEGGKDFFNLPLDKDVRVTFQTGWYFNDWLSDHQQSDYAAAYESQIRPLLEIVEPVTEEGDGVVVLRGWPYPTKRRDLPPKDAKFLRFVQPPWDTFSADISEEAWMAQEDLWIQKEIYRLIRAANDYVGKMKGDPVKGLNQTGTYVNPYFELKLKLLDEKRVEATVKNLQNYRQKLDISFRFRINDSKTEKIKIEGEPLDPKGTKDAKGPRDSITKVINLTGGTSAALIADVEQVLTWETAAVRRIDEIVIGGSPDGNVALNHRALPEGVRPFGAEPKRKEIVGEGGVVPAPRPMRDPAAAQENIKGNIERTPHNKLIKTRYCEETTDQTRRIPVAISLIVDQDHIDRVLTSFGNSKFRFLLNQILVNRYPLSIRPPIVATKDKGAGFPKLGGLRPGVVPTGDENEMEPNVELVIYGTMTLYQRYPQAPTVQKADGGK